MNLFVPIVDNRPQFFIASENAVSLETAVDHLHFYECLRDD